MLENKKESKMKDLFKEAKAPRMPQVGELTEGKIIKMSASSIILDLGPLGTGIIYGG